MTLIPSSRPPPMGEEWWISVISGIISGISGSGGLNRGDAEKRGKTEAQPNPTTVLEVEEGWFRIFRPFRSSAIQGHGITEVPDRH